MLRQGVCRRSPQAADAVDPEDAAFQQAHRAQGHLGEPELLAEIEYRAKSAEGKVRHPFFKGLREACEIRTNRSDTLNTPRSSPIMTRRTGTKPKDDAEPFDGGICPCPTI
jgi:hypothetical protein